MKKQIILSALIIFPLFVSSQNLHLFAIDYLLNTDDFNKGEQFFLQYQFDSASYYYNLAANKYAKIGLVEKYLKSKNKLIDCYINLNNLDKAIYPSYEIGWFFKNNKFSSFLYLDQKAYYLLNAGKLECKLGSYDFAYELISQGINFIRIHQNAIENSNYYLSWFYDYLGLTQLYKEEIKEAQNAYEVSLKYRKMYLKKNHQDIGRNYYYLGILSGKINDFDKALQYNKEALRIINIYYGEESKKSAKILVSLGYIYNNKGEFNKSIEYHIKAKNIFLKNPKLNKHEIAIINNNLGSTYYQLGNNLNALTYFQKSKLFYEKNSDKYKRELALAYNNIAGVYDTWGLKDTAINYYRHALQIRQEIHGEKHVQIAQSLNSIGQNYFSKNNYLKAIELFQRAIIANHYTFNDTNIYSSPFSDSCRSIYLLYETFYLKANALLYLFNKTKINEDIEASISSYEQAIRYSDVIKNDFEFEGSKLYLTDKLKQIYSEAILANLILEELSGKNANEKVFEYLEKNKNYTLYSKIQKNKAKYISNISNSEKQMENDISSIISFAKTQRQILINNVELDFRLKTLDSSIFHLEQKHDSIIQVFKRKYPLYKQSESAYKIPSLLQLKTILKGNSALVEYFINDTILIIQCISNDSIAVVMTIIDTSFYKAVSNHIKNIKLAETAETIQTGKVLFNWLIEPIYNIISKKETITIIPDDILFFLPFESIIVDDNFISQKGTKCVEFPQIPYLIKDFNIVYHYSATLYMDNILSKKSRSNDKETFIGFAPVFNQKNAVIKEGLFSSDSKILEHSNLRSITIGNYRFKELPYSEKEITEIIEVFRKKGKKTKSYISTQATELNFINEIFKYKYVHIATHGIINNELPTLSGIIFSQKEDTDIINSVTNYSDYLMINNNKTDYLSNDGILYASEISNLNINADLLVLSACETGLGKLAKGEGLLSMVREFLLIGANNVVFSLWKISDMYTKTLMVNFYTEINEGKNYSVALRNAKLKMIQNKKTSLPIFWSGFILVGS